MKEYSIGIDTSNYKTSVAVVDKEDNIIYDGRIFLEVKDGMLGIRQQEALFQHISNLPILLEEAFDKTVDGKIISVSASSRPRPLEGSYMPCFLAGMKQCDVIGSLIKCEKHYFSHQEGHLASAVRFTKLRNSKRIMFTHFSGGTTEILLYDNGRIDLLGGSLDISFGQLLDRTANELGFKFPGGEKIDSLAFSFTPTKDYKNLLPRIKMEGLSFNLSGIETAAKKILSSVSSEELSYMLFERILECIKEITETSLTKEILGDENIDGFLFSGGVSASKFIRRGLKDFDKHNICFSDPALSSDNAIGIAFLGGDKFWPENQ